MWKCMYVSDYWVFSQTEKVEKTMTFKRIHIASNDTYKAASEINRLQQALNLFIFKLSSFSSRSSEI